MSSEAIEKELAELKERVARLEQTTRPPGSRLWMNAFGKMKDDDIAQEAARLGAEWRAMENARG